MFCLLAVLVCFAVYTVLQTVHDSTQFWALCPPSGSPSGRASSCWRCASSKLVDSLFPRLLFLPLFLSLALAPLSPSLQTPFFAPKIFPPNFLSFSLQCLSLKAFAKCIQRSTVGTSNNKIVNMCSDEDCMASDSNAPFAALKTHKCTSLALEIGAHSSMPGASRARHATKRTT
jgi:hypothetical protein